MVNANAAGRPVDLLRGVLGRACEELLPESRMNSFDDTGSGDPPPENVAAGKLRPS